MSKNNAVILNPNDNIAVIIDDVSKGGLAIVDEQSFEVASTITFGHKIAIKPIAKGEHIIKYGVPIGVATADLEVGQHVHVHNMESLYMKQFSK